MVRVIVSLMLLLLGAVALARGLYLHGELTRQLDTGTMGAIRSWVMWSTTDGRELVAWYRMVTPWLIWGGGGLLVAGVTVAIWPTTTTGSRSDGAQRDISDEPPAPRRKPRRKRGKDA